MFAGLDYFDKTCSLRCHTACEGKHKASEERNKKSAEEIACALAPIFIMAEIRFLSQYTAVSQERRPTILIQLGFYSLLLAVSDASSYFLFLTFVQLFGSKLKRIMYSDLYTIQTT